MTDKLKKAIQDGNVALINDNIVKTIELSSLEGQEEIKAIAFDSVDIQDETVKRYNLRKRNMRK